MKREDGIVWIDYRSCVGCGYCAMACPYRARHFMDDVAWAFPESGPTPDEAARDRHDRRGVMTKCTFCMERVDGGRARGLTPGVDAAATPMCGVACIAGAIIFGDLDDPASAISRLIKERTAVTLMAETGTDPSVYYLTD
jgi:phenylacetyl-CoA:acceptor oxidoreductase subunit 1